MSRREVIAYAITHAPRGVKGLNEAREARRDAVDAYRKAGGK